MTRIDAVVPGPELTLDLCESFAGSPVRARQPGVTLLLPACELGELAPVGDGQAPALPRPRPGRDAGSAIAFGLGAQLDRYRRPGHYDVAFRLAGEPLERHRRAAARRPPGPRRSPSATTRLREWLADQWRLPAEQRSTDAAAIFAELALEGATNGRRPLLESEAFRALVGEPGLAQAA